ncbi:hypothetical protein Naga_100354g4 [Nannochloropsis gaditana]|uniref:Uncharacterized protein n=1 Tax=Nannochloropsis gaditana TaxID=72520 RepID=W7TF58_9STRA|nr:hypothetical protein Naga_100354g4 [Nannochloropsis gaditana]
MSLYFDKDHALRLLTACKNDDVATLAAMINEDPALLLFETTTGKESAPLRWPAALWGVLVWSECSWTPGQTPAKRTAAV